MMKAIVLGLGATALLGGGLWLARSSSEPAPVAATATPTSVRSAAISVPAPAARAARMPVLQPRGTVATPGLAADLGDADPKVRRAAIREAARDPQLDPAVLLAASRDRDLDVGIAATIALGKRYAEGDVPAGELIARVTDRGLNDRVRLTALNAIGLVASADGAALLVDLVAHGSPLERASAAILLVHQDPELAMPALIGALADTDELVRVNALDSLRARSRGRDFGTDAPAWRAWWQARPR